MNFDGIVGPTHLHGGLSYGNVASMKHGGESANPRKAALQGLRKMKTVMDLGVPQAVLPPHRPHFPTLRKHGFPGDDETILRNAYEKEPELLSRVCSASPMWTANAATVSPSADTRDGKLHITPANLISQSHRSMESPFTTRVFRKLFSGEDIEVHDPLEDHPDLSDEGAANHMRLAASHGESGVEIFVYGRNHGDHIPTDEFPPRQTKKASQKIADNHQLSEENTMFVQQNPAAIDRGVFHNDVIAVSNENLLFLHENAYKDTQQFLNQLEAIYPSELHEIRVPANLVSIQDAVDTYVFNSQIVTRPDGTMTLIAARRCKVNSNVTDFLTDMVEDSENPIAECKFVPLQQSMKNGGGPACLRLRVVMTKEERECLHEGVVLNEQTHAQLVNWVKDHYRERLSLETIVDNGFLAETRGALDKLTKILDLDNIYPFQNE
ncbi:MAG: N-succinylarginine dihydrolase [bacterium]